MGGTQDIDVERVGLEIASELRCFTALPEPIGDTNNGEGTTRRRSFLGNRRIDTP